MPIGRRSLHRPVQLSAGETRVHLQSRCEQRSFFCYICPFGARSKQSHQESVKSG